MNLFLDPSETELQKLISKARYNKPVHVVVDFDGEVLVDPQLSQPELDLNKFKFHVQLSQFSKRAITSGSNHLKYLLNHLLTAWNNSDDSNFIIA